MDRAESPCGDRLSRSMPMLGGRNIARPRRAFHLILLAGLLLGSAGSAAAAMLWSRPEKILVRTNGAGEDLLHGAVKPQGRDSSSTLYFRFTVTPLSDISTERNPTNAYAAGLVFFEAANERLGIGNALRAWGYSAFNVTSKGPDNETPGEWNLISANYEPETTKFYEAPRRGTSRTIVFKVQYVPGTDASVTVWLSPNLEVGATEFGQSANRMTQFKANACFDEIRLLHRGGGEGWEFSNLAIATAFEDFVPLPFWRKWWVIALAVLISCGAAVGSVMMLERRRARLQIQRLEQARAVAQERARIAQDLHDDLGVRLTEIAYLGDLGRRENAEPGQLADSLRRVARIARESIETADGIVWAVNPRNDSLHHLANYLVQFAEGFFRHTPVRCRLDVPVQMPAAALSTTYRHQLLLAIKEACHNVVRHSGATEVWLRLAVAGHELCVSIEDNGRGFDPGQAAGSGDGLRNMEARMTSLGGRFELTSRAGEGTLVRLVAPLPPSG